MIQIKITGTMQGPMWEQSVVLATIVDHGLYKLHSLVQLHLQLHFPLLSSFTSLSRVKHLQLRGGKGLFGLQFHVTAHHFGEVKAGIQAANRTHSQVLKEPTHPGLLKSAFFTLTQLRIKLVKRCCPHGLRLPPSNSNQENLTDMSTGKPDADSPSFLTLFPGDTGLCQEDH